MDKQKLCTKMWNKWTDVTELAGMDGSRKRDRILILNAAVSMVALPNLQDRNPASYCDNWQGSVVPAGAHFVEEVTACVMQGEWMGDV
jgi:hypothetical protein